MTRRRAVQGKTEGSSFLRINTSDVYGGIIRERADVQAQGELAALAASIARHGLLQPIVVRRGAQAGRYALVCGARRLAACRMLGMEQIEARLIDGDDAEGAACFLEEHLTRKPPGVIDEAKAAARVGAERLRARFVLPWRELDRRLRLLALGEEVCALVRGEGLELEQAEPLLAVSDAQRRLEAASVIAARDLTGGQARRLVFGSARGAGEPANRRAVREALAQVQRLAAKLSRQGVSCAVTLHAQERGMCVQILFKRSEDADDSSRTGQEKHGAEANNPVTGMRRARRAQLP